MKFSKLFKKRTNSKIKENSNISNDSFNLSSADSYNYPLQIRDSLRNKINVIKLNIYKFNIFSYEKEKKIFINLKIT